ncbi:hypothetical protein JAAARDRAFT_73922 [Jaapia argillacea MUCL 33604]|uniref:Uncharacterized protein n=1 Tax=Jaapia argillacea MUCL 33604 TaxID=933084 RepID=A0A067P8A7_9AGAM|nr:hypothetical protein JAAARDRAFT_73922 [Jaapia argillacea MUCL 33604]
MPCPASSRCGCTLMPARKPIAPGRSHHHTTLLKGFDIVSIAGTFIAAVQAQAMSTTLGNQEAAAIRIVNALYLCGFVFDLMAACLSFLTSRWLQCLTMSEKCHLEVIFGTRDGLSGKVLPSCDDDKENGGWDTKSDCHSDPRPGLAERMLCSFFATCLFLPLPFLIIGVVFMCLGLLVYTWEEHTRVVAILVSCSYVVTLPFVSGVVVIGRDERRRMYIIECMSRMQGDL